MNRLRRLFAIFGLASAACSTSGGGRTEDAGSSGSHEPSVPEQVAGGQSGSDSEGSGDCDLENATITDIPVDVKPMYVGCSPDEAVSRLSWKLMSDPSELKTGRDDMKPAVFDCHDFGRYVVEVEPATAARLRTGVRHGDDAPSMGSPCGGLAIDALIHVRPFDGGDAFEAEGFETDQSCWEASITAVREDGAELTIIGNIATMIPIEVAIASPTAVECTPVRPSQVPSSPANFGGAGGEGGASSQELGGAPVGGAGVADAAAGGGS